MDYSGRIRLFEMNEPLTEHRLVDMLKYAKEKVPKAWHMLVSNGDLLTPKKTEELFVAGLDYLNLCSYSDNSYVRTKTIMRNIPKNLTDRIAHKRMDFDRMSDNRKREGYVLARIKI